MSVSAKQRATQFRELVSALPALSQALGETYGSTAVALVKERSIEEGIDKNGVPGSKVQYSTKTYPTSLLKGKELNQGGRNYVDKNKSGNWYGLRQAEGLRSKNVNLTHTGDSWKQYGVLRVTVSNSKVSIQVGISGSRADVFGYNVDRYGKFYRNTPTELAQMRTDAKNEVKSWFTRYIK
jgi:hypothetical protein